MDLRVCADSASFTEKKAEKVQWFLRSVSLKALRRPHLQAKFSFRHPTFTPYANKKKSECTSGRAEHVRCERRRRSSVVVLN